MIQNNSKRRRMKARAWKHGARDARNGVVYFILNNPYDPGLYPEIHQIYHDSFMRQKRLGAK